MLASDLPVSPKGFDKDRFLRRLLREVSGLLQDAVGLDEAAGIISRVGASMGRWLDASYRDALGVEALDLSTVARVLVDLKDKLDGSFEVVELSPERIVLVNRRCPFGRMVEGRPSLCMMTSSLFGRIAADNLGYARVVLKETIAKGDGRCHIVVYLRPGALPERIAGHEYYARLTRNDAV